MESARFTMQDLSVPAAASPEMSVSGVRDAITSLRYALDILEESLDALAAAQSDATPAAAIGDTPESVLPLDSERLQAVSSTWEKSHAAAPTSPEQEQVATTVNDSGRALPEPEPPPEKAGWASEAETPENWGQWSVPPALRDGAWPIHAQVEPAEAIDPASGAGPAEQPAEPRAEDEDVRDQVRRAVEQLREELGSQSYAGASEWDEDLDGSPTASTEVDGAIERPSPDGTETGIAEPPSQEDIRDQVRQAVIDVRAEIEDDAGTDGGRPEPQPLATLETRIPHYEPLLDKGFLAPASIVIEDPEGRVELVRVYRTLARLEVAATANLANYSSHSVTVQMEERNLPSQEDISDAISYAFERACSIDIEANRANVRLNGGKSRAA